MMNPIATLLTQAGHAFVDPVLPSDRGGWMAPVIIAIALISAVFAVGWWFFIREAPRVAENL